MERIREQRAEVPAQDAEGMWIAGCTGGAGGLDPITSNGIVNVVAGGGGEGNVESEQEVIGVAGHDLYRGRTGPAQIHSARRPARLGLCIHWPLPSRLS